MEYFAAILLSQGKMTYIDYEDLSRLDGYKWYAEKGNSGYYATCRRDANDKSIKMARLIMDAPKGKVVDHINHDTLDNRKFNLRIITNAQNQANRVSNKNTSSKYKGVYLHNNKRNWI